MSLVLYMVLQVMDFGIIPLPPFSKKLNDDYWPEFSKKKTKKKKVKETKKRRKKERERLIIDYPHVPGVFLPTYP